MDSGQINIAVNAKYESYSNSNKIYELLDKESLQHNQRIFLDSIRGKSSYFSFTCPNCQTVYKTKKMYQIARNPVQDFLDALVSSPIHGIRLLIENTIGKIPWIGDTVEIAFEDKVTDKEVAKNIKFLNKSMIKAYKKEMLNNFIKLNNSEKYGCIKCINSSN